MSGLESYLKTFKILILLRSITFCSRKPIYFKQFWFVNKTDGQRDDWVFDEIQLDGSPCLSFLLHHFLWYGPQFLSSACKPRTMSLSQVYKAIPEADPGIAGWEGAYACDFCRNGRYFRNVKNVKIIWSKIGGGVYRARFCSDPPMDTQSFLDHQKYMWDSKSGFLLSTTT